jgi:ATP-dependent helicase/nuclease subunit A
MCLGRAWHALLELGEAASIDSVVRAHALTPAQAESAVAATRHVRREWPQFFGATAEAELELVAANGDVLRVDRLIELEEALWIIDFKWRVTEDERLPYEAQVRRYAQVLQSIRGDKPVRIGLITAAGKFSEVVA